VTFYAKNLEFSLVQGEQRFLTAIDDLQSNLGLNILPPESKLSNWKHSATAQATFRFYLDRYCIPHNKFVLVSKKTLFVNGRKFKMLNISTNKLVHRKLNLSDRNLIFFQKFWTKSTVSTGLVCRRISVLQRRVAATWTARRTQQTTGYFRILPSGFWTLDLLVYE
jgi:hypothetical protein